MRDHLVLGNVRRLAGLGLLAQLGEDGYGLAATEAGRLMAQHCIRLPTMALIIECPQNRCTASASRNMGARLTRTQSGCASANGTAPMLPQYSH